MLNKNRNKIIDFIKKNGWILDDSDFDDLEEYKHYCKKDNIRIDIGKDEIVLIGDSGDFLHLGINNMSVYTLLGYLIQYHYLAIDYKW